MTDNYAKIVQENLNRLYSNNANQFMPVDGLADVGEYTSRKILNLID